MPLYTPFFNTLDLRAYSRTGTAVRLYSVTCFVSRTPPGSFLEHRSEIWDAKHMPDSKNGCCGSAGGRRGRLLTKIEITLYSRTGTAVPVRL